MKKKSLSPAEIAKTLGHAFEGVRDILKTEHMAWFHSIMTVAVLLLCWWLQLETLEFCFIVLAIVSVWVAEAFNTVFEILTDFVSPDYSIPAKRAKDMAAAAVLISCLGALSLGLLILGPALYQRLFVQA